MEFNRPILRKNQRGRFTLYAEYEARIEDVDILGTCFVGFATYMVSGLIRSYVEIGRYCSIGRNVSIGLGEHNYNALSTSPYYLDKANIKDINVIKLASVQPKRRVIIGNDVWIGDGAYILNGVTIGDGAIIGCNAVITKSIAPYTIVAGVLAKPIKKRFEQKTEKEIIASNWFMKDPQLLRKKAFSKQTIEDQIIEINKIDKLMPIQYIKISNVD